MIEEHSLRIEVINKPEKWKIHDWWKAQKPSVRTILSEMFRLQTNGMSRTQLEKTVPAEERYLVQSLINAHILIESSEKPLYQLDTNFHRDLRRVLVPSTANQPTLAPTS